MSPERRPVSCIVPVHNGERFLDQALDSIFGQTSPPAEVIVINDGSTDHTAEILRSRGDRIRVVTQPRSGPAAARNAGIILARYPMLAFLDADDVWEPVKLERQLTALAERPELGFVLSHIANFWEPGAGTIPEEVRSNPASVSRPGFYFQTMLVQRWAFDQVGGLDESLALAEDIDWFARAIEYRVPYLVVPDLLVRRRIHGGNLTGLGGGDPDRFLDILRRSVGRRRGGGTPAPGIAHS